MQCLLDCGRRLLRGRQQLLTDAQTHKFIQVHSGLQRSPNRGIPSAVDERAKPHELRSGDGGCVGPVQPPWSNPVDGRHTEGPKRHTANQQDAWGWHHWPPTKHRQSTEKAPRSSTTRLNSSRSTYQAGLRSKHAQAMTTHCPAPYCLRCPLTAVLHTPQHTTAQREVASLRASLR